MGTRTANQLLSSWSLSILFVITAVVVWTSIDRFQDPVGEKHIPLFPPGGADFFHTFSGARALVLGENPYFNDRPEFINPWNVDMGEVEGRRFKTNYFPTHNLFFVPLALWTDDWRVASRALFFINVMMLFGLAYLTWALLARIMGWAGQARRVSLILVPLLFVLITMNLGTSLGLERGDAGDFGAALMVWSAVLLFLKGRRFLPMLLGICATLMKGYGLVFLAGLGALSIMEGRWKAVVSGVLVALLIFVFPVARYLPEWWLWMQFRLLYTFDSWLNYSFVHFFEKVSPAFAEAGPLAITILYAATSLVCWLRARTAMKTGSNENVALWLTLFSVTALTTTLTAAPMSAAYSLIIVLPGILAFFLASDAFLQANNLPTTARPILGTLLLITAFLLFKMKLVWATVSMASLALIAMVFIIAASMLYGLVFRRPPLATKADTIP